MDLGISTFFQLNNRPFRSFDGGWLHLWNKMAFSHELTFAIFICCTTRMDKNIRAPNVAVRYLCYVSPHILYCFFSFDNRDAISITAVPTQTSENTENYAH